MLEHEKNSYLSFFIIFISRVNSTFQPSFKLHFTTCRSSAVDTNDVVIKFIVT